MIRVKLSRIHSRLSLYKDSFISDVVRCVAVPCIAAWCERHFNPGTVCVCVCVWDVLSLSQ